MAETKPSNTDPFSDNPGYWNRVEAAWTVSRGQSAAEAAAAQRRAGTASNSAAVFNGSLLVGDELDASGFPIRQSDPGRAEREAAEAATDDRDPVTVAHVIGALPLAEQVSHTPPDPRG